MDGRVAELWFSGVCHRLVSPVEFLKLPPCITSEPITTLSTHSLYSCEPGAPGLWIVPTEVDVYNSVICKLVRVERIVNKLNTADYIELLQTFSEPEGSEVMLSAPVYDALVKITTVATDHELPLNIF